MNDQASRQQQHLEISQDLLWYFLICSRADLEIADIAPYRLLSHWLPNLQLNIQHARDVTPLTDDIVSIEDDRLFVNAITGQWARTIVRQKGKEVEYHFRPLAAGRIFELEVELAVLQIWTVSLE